MTSSREDAVSKFVDDRPVSLYQYAVIALCGLVMFLDGFDTQAISYVAPFLADQWGVAQETLGAIFSSALVGLMVGYVVVSPQADRIGHKRMMIFASVGIGLFTLLTSLTQTVTEIIVLRFLTGISLGSAIPSAISLTSEFSPKRFRASFILVIYVGFSLGFVAAGLVAGWLIPLLGWRAMFWAGSAGPLLLVPVLYVFLPESVVLMIRKGADPNRMLSILRRIDPHVSRDYIPKRNLETSEPLSRRLLLSAIFSRHLMLGTVLLWVVFAVNLGEFYALQSWLPTILQGEGYSLSVMVIVTTLTTVGGIAAAFIVGPAMDRISSYGTVGIVYLLGFGFLILLGFTIHAPFWALATVSFFVGFCVSGGQKSVIALATIFYPTSIRGPALGWALGIGRIGGIGGPLIVGAVMNPAWHPAVIFSAMAVPMLAISTMIFALGRVYGQNINAMNVVLAKSELQEATKL